MEYRGIKRVGGRGYENKFVIFRRRKKKEYAFFFFLLLFGGAVYSIASAIFRSVLLPSVSASLPVFF
ncbi:MAG: hypothetical protein J5774_04770 [Clostridia bacterium]|nr:hypothetical protein [Clostridia bacterium]